MAGGLIPLIILLVITILFGRVYCSFLCPLGIMQDGIIRISDYIYKITHKGKKRKSNKGYKKPHNLFRYIILIITGALFALGFIYPLTLLDPYSIFGKIAVEIFGSIEIFITNILANIFPYTFYFQEYLKLAIPSFIYSSLLLLTIILMSSLRGRLYCNTICPVGSFLGLISGHSLFKVVIDKEKCVQCNACSIACKSNCINIKDKSIDNSRCVACFNCLSVCKQSSIKFAFGSSNKQCDTGRRNAIVAVGALGTALIAKNTIGNKLLPNELPDKKKLGIAPPGAISIKHLKENCTACYACVASCPNNIIKPATFEYGPDGIMLPTIKFDNKFCGYECNKCSQVCPNGALVPLTLEEKKLTKIGQVAYYPKKCIVFTDSTDCGACDEHCPTKAITMVKFPDPSFLYHPKINRELCIGCGGCEYVCPQTPKAIKVIALPVQGKAQKPTEDIQENKKVDDFGF
jgi:Polyferredoxin